MYVHFAWSMICFAQFIMAPRDLPLQRNNTLSPASHLSRRSHVRRILTTTSLLAEGPKLQRKPEDPGEPSPWFCWWNWYSRSELRDEKVVLFADQPGKGTYEYSYTIRATQPGIYQVIPTTANELYFPEMYGRGDGATLVVH